MRHRLRNSFDVASSGSSAAVAQKLRRLSGVDVPAVHPLGAPCDITVGGSGLDRGSRIGVAHSGLLSEQVSWVAFTAGRHSCAGKGALLATALRPSRRACEAACLAAPPCGAIAWKAADGRCELRTAACDPVGCNWDFGAAPNELLPEAFPLAQRRDHLAVVYDTNILGRVPNAMSVVVPRPEHARALASEEGGPSIMRRYNKKLGGVFKLRTKKPKWNGELEAWTMDFKGRVKIASKKNFQMIDEDDKDETVLMMFGKAAKHRFSLDYRAPITAIQAMSIALTSFADKLVVT